MPIEYKFCFICGEKRMRNNSSRKNKENIQMFLLNIAFISPSEVENIHIFHFTSEIKTIFNENHLNFLFIIYNPFSKEVHFTFFQSISLF